MYAGALLMLAGAPLALGSWWALVLLVPMTTVIVARLLDEERMLTAHLPGYADYCRSVRYRLLPGVW
jgi:protein-S-isoprenylcysteine O-methyltransferase Ste14